MSLDRALEGSWLTTSDVSRRLGVSSGTVRHYGELLRARGYSMPRREEEWLWSPELVELARVAYQVARAASPRLSFERALDLIEYAGRVAASAREGLTLPEVVARVEAAVMRLEGEVPARFEEAAGEVERVLEEVRWRAEVLKRELGEAHEVVERVREAELEAVPGGIGVVGALLLLSAGLAAPPVLEAVGYGDWARVLRVAFPYVGAGVLGWLLGWFGRRW